MGSGGSFRNIFWIVEIPVFFRCDKRKVWFPKAHSQKERLLVFTESLQGFLSGIAYQSIIEAIVGNLFAFGGFAFECDDRTIFRRCITPFVFASSVVEGFFGPGWRIFH